MKTEGNISQHSNICLDHFKCKILKNGQLDRSAIKEILGLGAMATPRNLWGLPMGPHLVRQIELSELLLGVNL